MCAKHAHACTLYVRRLIPVGIMDVRNWQDGRTRLFVGCCDSIEKGAQRPYDLFPGGIAPRSLLCVRLNLVVEHEDRSSPTIDHVDCSMIDHEDRAIPMLGPED